MANLKEIKRKIKSVYNTQKTTNAMKLVSTAKLKKAEELAKQSRVYANKIEAVMQEIAYKLNQFDLAKESRFFTKHNSTATADIIFVTSDKGLCGGFNIKTLKEVIRLTNDYKNKGVNVRLRAIGKVGYEFCKFQKMDILEKYIGVSSNPDYDKAKDIINLAIIDFTNGITDEIVLVHNGYKNMISQELFTQNLLPVSYEQNYENLNSLLEIEPEETEVIEELLKRYIEYSMYYALIDSLAAEHSARMQAMDNATNNAKERVRQLNLAYNKARQENITTELIEIISGVESMKG